MSDNNHENARVDSMSGGAVRVSFGAPAANAPAPVAPPSTRVYNGGHRIHGDGSAESTGGVTRWVHSTAGTPGASIASTLQKMNGQLTAELEPGVPGSRTPVTSPVFRGLLRRDAFGGWHDVGAGDSTSPAPAAAQAAQQPEPQQQAEAFDTEGVFDAAEDAAIAADFANVPEPAFRSMMASATGAMVLGRDLGQTVSRFARDTGIAPEVASEMVENAIWATRQIVNRSLLKAGLREDDLDAFRKHLEANPGQYQNAVSYLTHGRDVSVFQKLGAEWLQRKDRQDQFDSNTHAAGSSRLTGADTGLPGVTEQQLREAGFETSVNRGGVMMVRTPGGNWQRASDLMGA